jgi:hypothetical protein
MDAEVMPHYVTMIESTSLDFPATLCHGALEGSYSCVWAIGNLDILKTRLIGFFCSTKCAGSVIVHIYDLARALRDSGISVISGSIRRWNGSVWTCCCAEGNRSSSAPPATSNGYGFQQLDGHR